MFLQQRESVKSQLINEKIGDADVVEIWICLEVGERIEDNELDFEGS